MKKGFAVLGLGRFGTSVAIHLAETGAEVMVVDQDEANVHEVADLVTYAVQGDISDPETLTSLGIGNMDAVIVAIAGNIEASVMATILAKEQGVPYVIAKAQNEMHGKILDKVGADNVIYPEKEMGARIARNLTVGNFIDLFELSSKVSMVEMIVKPEWEGKTLVELDLRGRYGVNVVAVKRGVDLDVSPAPTEALQAGMHLLLTGYNHDLKKLMQGKA
ncbi:MAG TPA: potassium transporter Trk [Lachnospiraceae bacterium]|nr:potassium transporter Trk [Lachnospiraceae bacterium]HIS63063.1 TrkA family potassium uptake protein [Candidatus Scybalomonas excrementigallinarum]